MQHQVLATLDPQTDAEGSAFDPSVAAEAKELTTHIDEASDVERRAHFQRLLEALDAHGGVAGDLQLGCAIEQLHSFVCTNAAAASEDGGALLVTLAQIVCLWGSETSMAWCWHLQAESDTAAAAAGASMGSRREKMKSLPAAGASALAADHASSGGVDGSVLGRDFADEGGGGSGSAVRSAWAVILGRAVELRLWQPLLLLRAGAARYALSLQLEEELVVAVEQGLGGRTAAHFALLSPYPAVRGRAPDLVGGVDKDGGQEGRAEPGDQEALEWLVETAVRCNALDLIAASPSCRAAFVSLVQAETFPLPPAVSVQAATASAGSALAPGTAAYVVLREGAGFGVEILTRRPSELLAMSVAQLVAAGDVVGAGTLVLRATRSHPALAASSSAAVVALRSYLVRLPRAVAVAGGDGVREGVQRRCSAALESVEAMLR